MASEKVINYEKENIVIEIVDNLWFPESRVIKGKYLLTNAIYSAAIDIKGNDQILDVFKNKNWKEVRVFEDVIQFFNEKELIIELQRECPNETVNNRNGLLKPWSFTKNYYFEKDVNLESKKWIEVEHYTTKINISFDLDFLQVFLHIPYCGITANNHSSIARVRLDLDDKTICTSVLTCGYNDVLIENINLSGLVQDVSKGEHEIKLFACVINYGTLHIPFYDTDGIKPKKSKLFANLHILGYPK